MSDIVALAQGVVMAGVTGPNLDESLPEYGGYLLFPDERDSLHEIRVLTDLLRARTSGLAPVIAIDQEGGAVARLRDGVEAIPSMMAVGAAGDLELARCAGEQLGFDLRRAGCTLDCAPVLDLALEPKNTVIGTRSFGADPLRVAPLAAAFAAGLRASEVLPCFKHFPGHGSTSVDSHAALPIVDTDSATFRTRDLEPFAAVAADAPAMMSAHVVVRAFDAQRPATLSRAILSDLLRAELGFAGALLTDCLEMNAVAASGSGASAVDALAAGADLLIFSHNDRLAAAAVTAITIAVAEGRLPIERLADAHARVMRLREAGAKPLPIDEFAPHEGIGREIARCAVTLVRGLPHADPVASIAISFGGSGEWLHHEAPALEELSASIDPSPEEAESLRNVVAQSRRRPLLLARRAHCHPAQASAIAQMLDRFPDALVVSLLEPFDLPLFAQARHLLATCGDTAISIAGLADVIFGGSMPSGRLPI
ncbi:MAG TPA: glycoside hydrolase family 3 N-terminal domain-containing protein [Candidatus Cybelea sp.]|nr:glycoside hydrolase family 3 N-terminal domain-containing protein [Candidatus Cybelea sp.]